MKNNSRLFVITVSVSKQTLNTGTGQIAKYGPVPVLYMYQLCGA